MDISAKLVKELREKTGAGLMDCKKALVETNGDIEQAVDWLREKGIAKAAKKASRIAAEGACEVKVNENAAVIFELNCETDFVAKNDKFQDLVSRIGEALLEAQPVDNDQALETKVNGKVLKDMLLEEVSTIGENLTFRRYELVLKNDDQTFGAYVHMGGKIASLAVLNGVNQEVAKDIAMHVAASSPRYVSRNDISEEFIAHEKEVLTKEALNENQESDKPKPENIIEKMVEGRLNKNLKDICLLNQPFIKNPDETVEQYVKSKGVSVALFKRLAVGEGVEKKEENFADEVMRQVG
ncbi:MAG: translation elongation factor Ts [Candidatus Izemoplasmatales bacterium]|nr:translation elongation factor Ts [Candidatus Izemoplasmatales bacterium]MDY0138625.1 translation elongation factor Ts [Candidatus Izemoplasmatales bacterium]